MDMNEFLFKIDTKINKFHISGEFALKSNEILAIYAKSGAGKSTIIKSILNIYKNNSESFLNNKKLDIKDIGFVLQNNSLFEDFTVFDNIILSTTKSIYEDIVLKFKKHKNHDYFIKLLEQTGLMSFKNTLPKHLSGGQKQRLGIACALANKPKLLLLDESFNALDIDTKIEIFDLILKLKKEFGFGVIFVSHSEFDIVYMADFIISIENEKITNKISAKDFINQIKNNTFTKNEEVFMRIGEKIFSLNK